MNETSQEIKIKESRLQKFYQENSTKNSAEKNLKEDSKFNELWNFSINKKIRKEKYSNSKNFVSLTLSQISFLQIALKFATLYLFYPFLSRFFCINFPFKKFCSSHRSISSRYSASHSFPTNSTTNILTGDTKTGDTKRDTFSLSLLYACYDNKPFFVVLFKRSFVIHLCCQIIYSVRETNHSQNTKLYCQCYLIQPISELESRGTCSLNSLSKFTVWITVNGPLNPPKNITQLNTKLGFSVTHFI